VALRPDVEALHAEVLALGEAPGPLAGFLERLAGDDETLISLLRRVVPGRLLDLVASTPPWDGRPRVLAAVVLNPRASRPLALRLLGELFWRDAIEAARSPRLAHVVRSRAEEMLLERLPRLKLGERVALARLATPRLLTPLLQEKESLVLDAALGNPLLHPDALRAAIASPEASRELLGAVTSFHRWREVYAIRLEIVLQPRTPLALALGQLTSLTRQDLMRVAENEALVPLVCAAAQRILQVRESAAARGTPGESAR
jgi:hypothetical protein